MLHHHVRADLKVRHHQKLVMQQFHTFDVTDEGLLFVGSASIRIFWVVAVLEMHR
jgi:hypothetical protein